MTWQIHAVLPKSSANGPGTRCVIWVQGCSLGCRGCFNPDTHQVGGTQTTAAEVWRRVSDALPLDGITVSGGEPLQQPQQLADFLRLVRTRSATAHLGVIILTGFSRAEIEADPKKMLAVENADTVIAGRYVQARRLASGLRGSSNKKTWNRTKRYEGIDWDEDFPESEVVFTPDGNVIVTGMQQFDRMGMP